MTDKEKRKADYLRWYYFRDMQPQPSDKWLLDNCDNSLGAFGYAKREFGIAILDAAPFLQRFFKRPVDPDQL